MWPTEEIWALDSIVRNALRAAFRTHERLGKQGIERMPKEPNQFGEPPLVIDFEAEEAVLSSLRASGISIRVFSEEHGVVEIGTPPYPYTGFLDGMDGSYVCLHDYGRGRYATMLGIFSGEDPTYGDALVGGIREHATKRMFVGLRGFKTFMFEGNSRTPIVMPYRLFNVETRVYTDMYLPIEQRTYREKFEEKFPHLVNDTHCASVDYTDLLLGAADVFVEAMGKKQDLEKLVAYRLIIEAGGYVMDSKGNSLENQKCLSPGTEERLMIAASSRALAEAMCSYLAN